MRAWRVVLAAGSAGRSTDGTENMLRLVPDWDDRVMVVGEVGQTHDGSLGAAHALVDAIADAGAGAVKFQTHIAAAESRADEQWRVCFSYEDETRYSYWQRMEFSEDARRGLRRHTHDRGLGFVSSPFSLQAVDLLGRVGVDAWKIASGEVAHPQLLDAVARAGQPVVLSSGMSGWAELDGAVGRLRTAGARPSPCCIVPAPTPARPSGLVSTSLARSAPATAVPPDCQTTPGLSSPPWLPPLLEPGCSRCTSRSAGGCSDPTSAPRLPTRSCATRWRACT